MKKCNETLEIADNVKKLYYNLVKGETRKINDGD